MKFPSTVSLRSLQSKLAAVALLAATSLAVAQAPKSLLPAFGTEGREFTVNSRDGNTVKGWLPNGWNDNTDWAPVTATYAKLPDSPNPSVGAVRIKIEKVEEGGQLQLTAYEGSQSYAQGKRYVVSGWIRSAEKLPVIVGARQMEDPYEFFHEQELSTETEWKRFEFAFAPNQDLKALIMFVVRETGTVDLAGVSVEQKQ